MKVWDLSQPVRPLPPLAKLGILNCYFFIAYLGFTEHEMDFDTNLFFLPHKSGLILRKILRSALYLLYNPNAKSLKDKYF